MIDEESVESGDCVRSNDRVTSFEIVSDVFRSTSRSEVKVESVPPRLLSEHRSRVSRSETGEELFHRKGEHVVVGIGRREEGVSSVRREGRHS